MSFRGGRAGGFGGASRGGGRSSFGGRGGGRGGRGGGRGMRDEGPPDHVIGMLFVLCYGLLFQLLIICHYSFVCINSRFIPYAFTTPTVVNC